MTEDKPMAKGRYSSAEGRWAGVGPYYAMFPTGFAEKVIEEYTEPGDSALDPFAGRGTALFSAACSGRHSLGVEINPVGYVYAMSKLDPAPMKDVLSRLDEVEDSYDQFRDEADNLPEFFQMAFSPNVLAFLVAMRRILDWKSDAASRSLMAIAMISLHGKRSHSLSNQMRQTTALAPDYCVRWWRDRELQPPDVNPMTLLEKRVRWRYGHGSPDVASSEAILGDSRKELSAVAERVRSGGRPKFKLLITSPPYHNVTNYYYDQWIRNWLLGGPDRPTGHGNQFGGKFSGAERYRKLLREVFLACAPLLRDDAVVYVRVDRRPATLNPTLDALRAAFPGRDTVMNDLTLGLGHQVRPYARGGAPKSPQQRDRPSAGAVTQARGFCIQHVHLASMSRSMSICLKHGRRRWLHTNIMDLASCLLIYGRSAVR